MRRVLGGYKNAKAGKVLRHEFAKGHYSRVRLYRGLKSNSKRMLVHHLVLAAFVGTRPSGMQGCHCDGNPRNIAADNLRWDTAVGNYSDRYKHGTDLRGERNPKAILTAAQVSSIRAIYRAGGVSQSALAAQYGVVQTTISHVVRGDSWTK